MIKVIFFSQNSKFRVRNSHFSHRLKGKIRATGTGFRSDRSQTTKPRALLDLRALSILARISAPLHPFKNPDFPKTGSYLGNIEHSCVATNFDFDPGNFPAQERSTAPFVPQSISFPTGGRFVPAKHRLPGREAGSREGWKNRVQSLSLSRRRHLRRGPAGRRSVPGPKA